MLVYVFASCLLPSPGPWCVPYILRHMQTNVSCCVVANLAMPVLPAVSPAALAANSGTSGSSSVLLLGAVAVIG